MLSDVEIITLEKLLQEQKIDLLKQGLSLFNKETNPNYKFLHEAITNQKYGAKGELLKGFRGVVLEGSSRSGKTWAGIDIIIWLCTQVEESCTINIYRETYNEFKTTLYDDFKRRLDDFDLDNPFHRAKEIRSFKIRENTIYFLGDGKHGGGCDYAFYNEAMFLDNSVFDQSEMRCRKFWWMDYNPSFTDHWVFDKVTPRSDVGFIRTTFLDNPFISTQEKNKILSYNPWEIGSYEVKNDAIYYNNEPVNEKNQPPINVYNHNNGTADEFMWKVYGLGLRGAMKGVIYEQLEWIDSFPENEPYIYANDFGYTNDPNVLIRYAEDENNIYAECLTYQSIPTPEELAETFEALRVEKFLPIACDSSDKISLEKHGTVEMVRGLRSLGYREAFKISKRKSKLFWINSIKSKKLHVVKNHLWKKVKTERENYIFKEINGVFINRPIDGYDHFFDALKYAHIAHNSNRNKSFESCER